MKKILCLVLVLILSMSVAMTASAADAALPDIGNIDLEQIGSTVGSAISSFEMPQFASLDEAFNALADFLKFEAIMVYVDMFHEYMGDFYIELDAVLKSFGVVINGILSTVFLAK